MNTESYSIWPLVVEASGTFLALLILCIPLVILL
jgi:hypothetical protein